MREVDKKFAAEVKYLHLLDGRIIILSGKDIDQNLLELHFAEMLEQLRR